MALAQRKETAQEIGVHYATTTLLGIYEKIKLLDESDYLREEANRLLGELVTSLRLWRKLGYEVALLNMPELQDVRKNLPPLCAKIECLTEKEWWHKCLSYGESLERNNCDDAWCDDYKHIVRAEVDLLRNNFGRVNGFSFVGSGAVPMTVIVAAKMLPEAVFECVDWDSDACRKSQNLIDKFNLAGRVKIINASAQEYVPARNFIPFIASLIEGKPEVYELYRRSAVPFFLVRDTIGVYEFIYKPAEKPHRSDWLEMGSTATTSQQFNTTRLFKSLHL